MMGGTVRQPRKGQPDLEIYNLFAALNAEQHREKHDIVGLYEGRLRSRARDFEGMKRRWEGFTGVPLPKRLRTEAAPPAARDAERPPRPDLAPRAKAEPDRPPVAKDATTARAHPAQVPAPPPHPDDDLDAEGLSFNDLRKECRRRKLKAVGKKAELQARLRRDVAEARGRREAAWAARHAGRAAVPEETRAAGVRAPPGPPHRGLGKQASSATVVSAAKKPAPPKSALKPSKYASCFARGAPHEDKSGVKPATSAARDGAPAPKPVPIKVSDSPVEASHGAAGVSNPAATSLAQTTAPGGSAFKAKAGGGSVRDLLEKKKAHARATEERKKRMAEMRQKAKPGAASVSSATKLPPSHSNYSSTLKKMASGSKLGESKPKSTLAKMREKAAAEKHTENVAAHHGSSTASSRTATKSTALKSILDPANKPTVSKPAKLEVAKSAATEPKEKPLSPLQTYEMSDREEESESDSESEEEEQRPKKAIPVWAQRTNLHRALERQFAEGPTRLDPDHVFGEVITCNLEEIFDKKKSRYQRRTSSGNWTKDHVTLAEKITYKQVMGYEE